MANGVCTCVKQVCKRVCSMETICGIVRLQWGNGFPNRWIWAEGQEHKETNATECLSSTLCGGDAGKVVTSSQAG